MPDYKNDVPVIRHDKLELQVLFKLVGWMQKEKPLMRQEWKNQPTWFFVKFGEIYSLTLNVYICDLQRFISNLFTLKTESICVGAMEPLKDMLIESRALSDRLYLH